MSNILNSEGFGLQLYNRFPPKYREDDVKEKYALKRYMQSMSDGGYKYVIDDINRLITLIDPSKVDSKYLPILFKQFGLEIFKGIPEDYLRFLLPRLGEAWSKKGSLDVVEFITSSISGIKTSTSVNYDQSGNPIVSVKLEMDYAIGPSSPNLEQLNRILQNFIPYFCDTYVVKSYAFYVDRSIRVKEDGDNINIKDTKIEIGNILGNSGLRLQPILNNAYKLLNSSFILNETYDYSLEPDFCVDKINIPSVIEETCGFETCEENGGFTNNESCTLNSGFYTNNLWCYDIITFNNGDTSIVLR